jgi:hypothetical protein
MTYTMNKTTLLSIAIAGLILVNLGLMAVLLHRLPAQQQSQLPPPQQPGPPHEGPKRIIIERLHFDPKQVAQYEELIEQHRAAIRSLEAEIRDTKNNLYLTLADSSRTGKDSLENRLGSLQKEIETVHYGHFEQIRRLCHTGQLPYFTSLTHDLAAYFAPAKNNMPPPKDR